MNVGMWIYLIVGILIAIYFGLSYQSLHGTHYGTTSLVMQDGAALVGCLIGIGVSWRYGTAAGLLSALVIGFVCGAIWLGVSASGTDWKH